MNEKKVTIITIICLVFILLAGGGALYYLQFVKLDELEIQLKAKEQAIELAKEQAKDMEDLIVELEAKQNASQATQLRGILDEAVYPLLDAISSFSTVGSRVRFVGEDALEAMLFIRGK